MDCITHDADTLKFIIDKVGSEKVCLGSDYPFPLGDLEIGKFIEEMGLSQEQLDDVYFRSTSKWLNLNFRRN